MKELLPPAQHQQFVEDPLLDPVVGQAGLGIPADNLQGVGQVLDDPLFVFFR